MKKFPLPLKIDCSGLKYYVAAHLADLLGFHFELVEFNDDHIIAHNPLNSFHYDAAWRLIDFYGVKAT